MPTFAEDMVTRIQDTLKENPGAKRVTFDGVTVEYEELVSQLEYWEKRVAKENKGKPRISKINLS